MTEATAPRSARLEGLDLARYVAFVGMVIVNFKIAMEAGPSGTWLDLATGALEGRAAATFVVLAGIGLGMAAQKGLDRTIAVTIKRALFLLVVGLLNMTVFDADIIHYYAFYFLFGVLLLPLGNGALFAVILALNIAFPLMILTLNYDAGWDWESFTYAGFWTPTGFVRNLFFNGWHPVIPWLGFLLFGVILSRFGLGARRVQMWLVLGGALVFLASETLAEWLGQIVAPWGADVVALVSTEPVPPMPLYTLAGAGVASIVIGVCLLAEEGLRRVRLLGLLLPAGRQTLTLYIAHILIGMGTLESLGMLGGQSLQSAVAASLWFCLAATVYAWIWARWFKRGPIEALMRKVAG